MPTTIDVRLVTTAADRTRFLRFPWQIYKGDPHWVPPLLFEREEFFDPERNPYFEHSEVALFLLERDGELAGTISAHVDSGYQESEPGTGFFGFLEVIDDLDCARALFEAASGWLRSRGMKRMIGPFNFNTNHECGLLVDGFDSDPLVLMTHTPAYYASLAERAGLEKAREMYGYWIDADSVPKWLDAMAERFTSRHPEISIRNPDLKRNFWGELEVVRTIYNDAWSENWGFVRLSDDELLHMAKGLKPMLDPSLVFIVEVSGEPAAFALALPDWNQVVKPMNGRRFPTGWLHYLRGRSRMTRARVFALGVRKQFQRLPFGPPLYRRIWQRARELGYEGGEASWVLEDNHRMRGPLEKMGARIHKTWRIYGRDL